MEPLRLPPAVGVKVTLMAQLAPAARLVPHVLDCAKSPLAVIPEMASAALPEFESFTCCAVLGVPTSRLEKVSEEGVAEAEGAGARPVPVRVTLWGLPEASSVTLTVPERVPPAVGVKVMLMLQFAAAARLAPQVLVWAKSPLAAMLEILSVTFPEFVSFTDCAALVVPGARLANVRLVGARVTAGPVARPEPDKLTECGLPDALSLMERLAERFPAEDGVKVTPMEQFALGAKLEPQLLV